MDPPRLLKVCSVRSHEVNAVNAVTIELYILQVSSFAVRGAEIVTIIIITAM